MIPKDSDSSSDGEHEDPAELGWSEFDWEKYLREQDDLVHRYLGFYETLKDSAQRIDDVARCMGWDMEPAGDATGAAPSEENQPLEEPEAENGALEPYTLHQNPVYIATTAIGLSVRRSWERLASMQGQIPQPLAIAVLSTLHAGEANSLLAIQALDLGDYSMAVSLFKRAMKDLNAALNHLHSPEYPSGKQALHFREDALPRLFDLREIWLRVIAECRDVTARHSRRREESGPEA